MGYNAGAILAVPLAVVAGLAFVLQQSVNAALRNTLGSVAWAGFVSYAGGTLCMVVLAAALREPFPAVGLWIESAGVEWAGGLFGAIYIAISIFVLPRIGTTAFVTLFVAGQLLFSLALDHYALLGLAEHPVNLPRIAGAILVVIGAVLITRW